ncbi:MAG: sortase [Oscillospiraceae bacterium]|nr:sortase [Oscillospiraceae bacterium]
MAGKRGRFLIFGGVLLIAASFLLAGYNLADARRAENAAVRAADLLAETVVPALEQKAEAAADETLPPDETEIPDYILDPERELPVLTADGRDYIGLLEIPAVGLELPVIAEWSYDDLRIAPCRYAGSPYTGGFVIAGHNYTAHLGRVPELRPGDRIRFTDVDGNAFDYEVAVRETLPPEASEEMRSPDWDLTLFTCTLAGTARVTVRCVGVSDES